MTDMKKARNDGTWSKYNKKEQAGFKRELERLEKMFSGIEGMIKLPDALFVVDVNKEKNAVIEAQKRQIPVVGVVDTNCNPDIVNYVIPANDDAIRSIKLMASYMSEAITEGKDEAQEKMASGFLTAYYPDKENAEIYSKLYGIYLELGVKLEEFLRKLV